ncbi:unnamed protein product [Diplocarpon coronariae]
MLREIRTPNRSTDQEPSVLRKVHKKPFPEASTVAATEDAPTRAASHEVEELVKNLEATSLLEFESEAQGTMNEHLVSKFETWFRKQHAAATRLQESELRQDSPQTSHAAAHQVHVLSRKSEIVPVLFSHTEAPSARYGNDAGEKLVARRDAGEPEGRSLKEYSGCQRDDAENLGDDIGVHNALDGGVARIYHMQDGDSTAMNMLRQVMGLGRSLVMSRDMYAPYRRVAIIIPRP